VIVVVTDGMPNGSGDPEASLKEAECAKKEGIGIITIGTDDADRQFLKKLASLESLGTWVSSNNLKWAITESARLLPTAGHLKGRI
jgi:uncharacterized protein YegL